MALIDKSRLVSIIIPTYNRWPDIKVAVNSCLNQTYKDIEIIIVDDGSTDQTISELRKIHDPRLRIIEKPHTGIIGYVRNAGLKESRGDWLAFLDSDDYWDERKLEKQLTALSGISPDIAWSYTSYMVVTDAGTPGEKIQPAKLSVHSGDIFQGLLSYSVGATLPRLLMSKKLYEKTGAMDETVYHDDLDYLLRLAHVSPATAVNEPLLIINKFSSRPWTARDSLYHHQQMLRVNKLVVPLARKRGLIHQVEKNKLLHRRSILAAAKQARAPYNIMLAACGLLISLVANKYHNTRHFDEVEKYN